MRKLSKLYNICSILLILKHFSLFIYAQDNNLESNFSFTLSNAISPLNFIFTNKKNLEEIEKNLNIYRKISICEFSGTGKTQTIRSYVESKKSEYDVIWFFDANLDLNSEFIKLAKMINLKEQEIVVSEDIRTVFKDIKKYFSNKKRWLFVFDNLKIGYNLKVKSILKWENNGHIIFASEDTNFLPNIINMQKFSKEDSLKIAKYFLHHDKQYFANFIAEKFYNYPGIIIFATQMINNYPGLTLKEYSKMINSQIDGIKLNIDLVKKFLGDSDRELLNKIALINSNFSSDFIKLIHGEKNTLKDLIQLQKLIIINSNTSPLYQDSNTEPNSIYEINELITHTLRKSNSKHQNKKILKNIINKIIFHTYSLGKKENYIFFTSDTTLDNLKIIVQNAEKYDLNLYDILFLKSCLLEIYMDIQDYHSASELKNWFLTHNILEDFQKTWWKSDFKKFLVSEYLMLIGSHYYFSLCDIKQALYFLDKSLEIKNTLNSNPRFAVSKFLNLYYLVLINTKIKNLDQSNKFFEELKDLFSQSKFLQKDKYLLHSIQSYQMFAKKDYLKALEEVDSSIDNLSESDISKNDIINTTNILLKASILNSLSRYEEGLDLLKKLEKIHKKKAEDHVTLGIIYIHMSESYLGIKDLNSAKSILNAGKKILINDNKRNIKQFLDRSKSWDLDLSYAYKVEAEIYFFEKNYLAAKNSFLLSVQILQNVINQDNELCYEIIQKIDHINKIINCGKNCRRDGRVA
ncbi:MAG: hypothetical protein ISN64_00995 [Rickettsia sp.]|nr:hypothetical protein [Rickettsia sp.]